jgi:predicted DCC family thiol-disulfide oxidoreductase YuxK
MNSQTESVSSRYILAYDTYCGPCTKFKNVVDFLDKRDKIDFISLVQADKKGLLESVPTDLRYRSFHLILPNRIVKSGSEGVLELIAILPGGRALSAMVRCLPGGTRMVRSIYRNLSKLHDNGSCILKDMHDGGHRQL